MAQFRMKILERGLTHLEHKPDNFKFVNPSCWDAQFKRDGWSGPHHLERLS
jgi:hypothetical protein